MPAMRKITAQVANQETNKPVTMSRKMYRMCSEVNVSRFYAVIEGSGKKGK